MTTSTFRRLLGSLFGASTWPANATEPYAAMLSRLLS